MMTLKKKKNGRKRRWSLQVMWDDEVEEPGGGTNEGMPGEVVPQTEVEALVELNCQIRCCCYHCYRRTRATRS